MGVAVWRHSGGAIAATVVVVVVVVVVADDDVVIAADGVIVPPLFLAVDIGMMASSMGQRRPDNCVASTTGQLYCQHCDNTGNATATWQCLRCQQRTGEDNEMAM